MSDLIHFALGPSRFNITIFLNGNIVGDIIATISYICR